MNFIIQLLKLKTKKRPKTPFKFEFRSRRLFRSGRWEVLPPEYARILKSFEEFIDNPNRFPALNAWGGEGMNNIQSRRLVANVLACIIVNTDLIGGRVGLPTEAGLKTVSYDSYKKIMLYDLVAIFRRNRSQRLCHT